MKILTSRQIRQADAYTIEHEPIASVDLMERAAVTLYKTFKSSFALGSSVSIFCGPGNNGGDGIALARMLTVDDYLINLYLLDTGKGLSRDAKANCDRLPQCTNLQMLWLKENSPFPQIGEKEIVVDALFGTGLTRALTGWFAGLVEKLNRLSNTMISIDIPSGLNADKDVQAQTDCIIHADQTWTFQSPKLVFFAKENYPFVGDWRVLPIGLHPDILDSLEVKYYMVDHEVIKNKLKTRGKFDHKGNFGHALLIAGSLGKYGAAIVASRACMRSGVGLLTTHIPSGGNDILQTAIPEAMVSLDIENDFVSQVPDPEGFAAIGIGPGLGTSAASEEALFRLIERNSVPMVIDADGLNIIARNPEYLSDLPAGTILTPHPGEFERLFGSDKNDLHRFERMLSLAVQYQIVIVLKGAHTAIASPKGKLWLNNTGNPGMATAGSGDVLTGIVLSLLAQAYTPESAAIIAVNVHGKAGDVAAEKMGYEAIIASDIIDCLNKAFTNYK